MHALTLMREWSWDPGVVAPIVLGGIWYAVGRGRLHRRRVDTRTAWCFWLGMFALALALVSPLDAAADEIFSAHMVQHLLLILVAAPLLVLSAPAPELWWGLPRAVRLRVARRWKRSGVAARAWGLITAPAIVFVVHAVAIWYWHFPVPYEAAERSDLLHAIEHLCFFGTAALFWWVVIQPRGHRRLSYASAIPYILATMLHSGALGGLLVYAPTAWYPSHAAGAPLWGLSPLEDQQLAGVIMWIPAGFLYLAAAVWAAYRWITEDERRHPAARADEGFATRRDRGVAMRDTYALMIPAAALVAYVSLRGDPSLHAHRQVKCAVVLVEPFRRAAERDRVCPAGARERRPRGPRHPRYCVVYHLTAAAPC
jgi:putative membrane protein